MNDVFGVFRDKSAEVVSITHTGGYSDTETEETLGTVECDIQPFQSPHDFGIMPQEYGLDDDVVLRMFLPPDTAVALEAGMFVRYGGKLYSVSRTDKWEYGTEAVLRERD